VVKTMQTVITRYSEKEILDAVKELEKRGFIKKSEIVRVFFGWKSFQERLESTGVRGKFSKREIYVQIGTMIQRC
jgi:hypothetical protein